MSSQTTISPRLEALLYFVGLVLVYLASWSPPIGAPETVRTVFLVLGSVVIVVKYELSNLPKPQITTHQALYSSIALILTVVGGQISANYGGIWEAGLAVALIGAILAAYEDLGGQTPPTSPTVPPTITAPSAPTATLVDTTSIRNSVVYWSNDYPPQPVIKIIEA